MNLLLVVHNYPGNGPYFGGTELHTRDLAERLSRTTDHRVYVMYPLDGPDRRIFVIRDLRSRTQERFEITAPVTWETYHDEEFAQRVRDFIQRRRIDLVHFFHLIHFPLAFPFYAQQAGAAAVVANHDYYLVCRQFNLLTDRESRFCRFPEVTEQTCDLCLRQTYGYVPGTQRRRRHLISEVLRHVDGLHYVCHDERDRILAAYPHLSDSVDLVLGVALNTELPMLTDAESRPHSNGASAPATSAESKLPDSPLRVACIGNFARQKGADLLLALFDHYGVRRDLGEPLSVQFRVFGKLTPPYDQMARPSNNGIITFQGHYAPEQLPQLLKQCDVALFASIWPETFAIVLSEVWASGIVPVAPRLGAFAERIKDNVNGVLFDVLDNPGGVITVLDELAADRQRLRQLTANARDRSLTPIPTLDGNVRAYVQFWERVAANAGGSPELSAQRAAMLERASQTVLTPFWGTAARPAGNIHAHAGAGALQRRGNLAKRALVFYRRYGLSYTVRTAMRYPAIRRHIRDQAARP